MTDFRVLVRVHLGVIWGSVFVSREGESLGVSILQGVKSRSFFESKPYFFADQRQITKSKESEGQGSLISGYTVL